MNFKMKKIISTILIFALTVSFPITVSAKESIGNGLILSDDTLTLTEGASAIIAAAMENGFDASGLSCVSADPNVATVTPVASMDNLASFQVTYAGNGSTVIAIFYAENPAVVAYVTVNTAPLIMDIPSKLGTNRDNYCELVSYEFVPYSFNTYADFNDYKYTLNLQYKCTSYRDDGYSKWGCYGYFYDASGNVLSKVHLYCSSLSKGRVYRSAFHVPVNAVRFSIEGF